MHELLIVESDTSLSTIMTLCLRQRGFECDQSKSIENAYSKLQKKHYAVVIIDRVLPDGDGLDLVSYLHTEHYATRTLLISYKNMSSERIEGLERGADDYLNKPFNVAELFLRVKRLYHCTKLAHPDELHSGAVTVDLRAGCVTIDSHKYPVSRRELEVLSCLIRYAGTTISREHIIRELRVTSRARPVSETIDVYIRRIRTKIKPYDKLIHTHRGYGYSLLSS